MMDRSVAPNLKTVEKVDLLPLEEEKLSNNSRIYSIPDADHEVFQVQFILPAGKWQEPKKGVSNFTAKMLQEGTKQFTSDEIANQIDSLGAEISVGTSQDYMILKAMGITRHFKKVMEIVADILTNPIFPEAELELKKKITLQQLLVNEQKVDYLASRNFTETLYGADHPYGYKLHRPDIEAVTRQDLVDFHQNTIVQNPFLVFISGMIPDDFIQIMENKVGHLNPGKQEGVFSTNHMEQKAVKKEVFVEKPNAQQYAIRMGKHLFEPDHEDANNVKILTTLLGGFFGSRLMSNIREDKGFTYGIYSTVQTYANTSFLYMGTEVGSAYRSATLTEIYKEISRLQEERVGTDEMELVRNYMLGSVLNGIDGPHRAINVFRKLITQGKDVSDFQKFVSRIQNITPEDLLITAGRYYDPDSFIEVVAGAKQ